jgi:putative hydrolase of the HAD superfamily
MRSTVDAVVLDVGGVFFLPNPDLIGAILTRHGVESRPSDQAFHRAHYVAAHAYDHGFNGPEVFDDYIAAYLAALGVADHQMRSAHDAVLALFADSNTDTWSWLQGDTVDALVQLAELDLPLAIVSNANGTVERILLERAVCQVGEGEGVSVAIVVDSTVVGVQKPDPTIFSFALDALGVAADRTLYFGDTHKNDVVGALAAGMVPVQLDPYDLYEGDYLRVRSLDALVEMLAAG